VSDSRRAALSLAIAAVTLAVQNGIVMAFAVLYLPLVAEFGGSRGEVATVQSAVFLLSGFGSPLIGWAFDRLGPRRLFQGGAVLAAIDADLPGRLDASVTARLVDAYARPALVDSPAVDPGALAALETLCARGLTLAVVSNAMRTPGVVLRALLERHGLLGCFAHTAFSDEVGVRKPDPAIFAHALDVLGADRERAVHVGDDAILDVQGAAVKRALAGLGFSDVAELRIGKVIDVDVEAPTAAQARMRADEMCRKLLANPILEDYTIE
jgi:phosphoribosylformylglycinamidine synthase PurS subunit